MKIPDWAWNAYLRWTGTFPLPADLRAVQRFSIIYWTVGPAMRNRWLSPLSAKLQKKAPLWILLLRLRRSSSAWYRISSPGAAVHVFHRLGVMVQEGDFVRVRNGIAVMQGYCDADGQYCEFWQLDD
jgi:hypothetical protein